MTASAPQPTAAEPGRRRPAARVVAASVAGVAVVAVAAYAVLHGPLRDTEAGRLLHGDITGQDAEKLCAEFAGEHLGEATPAGFDNVQRRFDGSQRTWVVSGDLADGGGSFSCTLSWTPGASMVHLDDLVLP